MKISQLTILSGLLVTLAISGSLFSRACNPEESKPQIHTEVRTNNSGSQNTLGNTRRGTSAEVCLHDAQNPKRRPTGCGPDPKCQPFPVGGLMTCLCDCASEGAPVTGATCVVNNDGGCTCPCATPTPQIPEPCQPEEGGCGNCEMYPVGGLFTCQCDCAGGERKDCALQTDPKTQIKQCRCPCATPTPPIPESCRPDEGRCGSECTPYPVGGLMTCQCDCGQPPQRVDCGPGKDGTGCHCNCKRR